jgi:outer membrane protein OmpA-like peptidoglycan-associated protein
MKKRRSLDYDGLDGVLDAPKMAKAKSGWQPSYGLVAVVLVGAVGAYVSMFSVQQTTETDVAVQTVSTDSQPAEKPQPLITTTSPAPVATPTEPPAVAEGTPQSNESANLVPQVEQPIPVATVLPSPAEQPVVTSDLTPISLTVYFKLDSSKPNLPDKNQLTALVETAKHCPELIKLTGHTCNLGTPALNKALGLTRAENLKKLLVAHEIPAQNILIASEGMDKPAVSNETSKGQALNRRVELICQTH